MTIITIIMMMIIIMVTITMLLRAHRRRGDLDAEDLRPHYTIARCISLCCL